MENEQEIENIFHKLVDELKKELPDLGRKLAVDSKAIRPYGRPVKDEDKKENKDRRRDTDEECVSAK